MNNIQEILEDMRKITMLTGELSEIHVQNLKKWPYVVFDNINDMEIKYDLTKDYTKEVGEGYVSFTIDTDVPEDFEERCKALAAWVRDMFWKNIKISVNISDSEYTDSSLTKGEL